MREFLKRLEKWWRHRIVYPFFQRILRNIPFEGTIDLNKVHKLLIVRHDRIGDMIVTTPFFEILRMRYPHLFIGVIASKKNCEIIRYNQYIDAVYIFGGNVLQTLREIIRIRKAKYEVILNFIFNRTTSIGVLTYILSSNALSISQGTEKYRFYFNKYFSLPRNTMHMVQLLATIIEKTFSVSIDESALNYSITIPSSIISSIHHYLSNCNIPKLSNGRYNFILLNISPTKSRKALSKEQLFAIAEYLRNHSYNVIVTCDPHDRNAKTFTQELERKYCCNIFRSKSREQLLELAQVIHFARCVITPDTSVVHFASAMKTPVIAFYTTLEDHNEWQPWNVPHMSVLAEENKPVCTIDCKTILDHIDKFLSRY